MLALSAARRLRAASPIERWSLVNAVVMLLATSVALWTQAVWPLVLVGTGSLAGLVVLAQQQWTPSGRFGWANRTTALRLGVLCLLPLVPESAAWGVAALGLAVLVADGIDGWLARHLELTSEFGEFFDKETDTLFLLTLCALAVFWDALPVWAMGIGILRYVFVVTLFALQPRASKEERSSLASLIYVGMFVAMLTAFLPYPALYQPLVLMATVALLFSFGRDFWWIVRLRLQAVEASP
jgi:phosphatidylglycerophosphate synthase